MHGNDDSRSNCHDASIATVACGVGRSDGAQASRTHPTARLPRPSSGNGHRLHANVASLIEPCSGLLHPKARAPTHSSFGASKTMFVSRYPPCPTQLGITLGHPSFKLIKDIGQQIVPSHGGKREATRKKPARAKAGLTKEWDGPLGWAPAASTARICTLFAGQGTCMRHGMLRRVGFPQKEGAGRELIRRRLARRDEKCDMRPYLRHLECQREAGHMT